MKKLIASLGVLFAMCGSMLPARALDSTQNYYGQVLDPSWLNLEPRYVKASIGEALYNLLGSTGTFSNLSVAPSGGMYVSVGPSTSGQLGALYQLGSLAPFAVGGSPIGASGATQLAADSTQVTLQGLIGSPALSVGPLTAPGVTGTSISYLIECQVQEVSKTPQTQTFETLPNYNYTTGTANRDLADTISCKSLASSASATPTTPAVDNGYLAIASVLIPQGTASITSSNITMQAPFVGFQRIGAPINVSSLPHGDYVDTTNAQTVSGLKSFTGPTTVAAMVFEYTSNVSSFANPIISNDSVNPGPGVNMFLPSNSQLGFRGFTVDAIGTVTRQLFQFAPNGDASISGSFTTSSNVTAGNDLIAARYVTSNTGIYTAPTGKSAQLCANLNCIATALTIDTSGNATVSGGIGVNGDSRIVRPTSPNTGALFLGNGNSSYIYFDGSNYNMPGGGLNLGGLVSAPHIASSAEVASRTGVFQTSADTAYLCANATANCMSVSNSNNSGAQVSSKTLVLGTPSVDNGNAIVIGNATTQTTVIGTTNSNSIQGIPGNVFRIAQCTTSGSGPACNSGAATYMTMSNNGNMGIAGSAFAAAFNVTSSRKLKRDVVPFTGNALSEIDTIRPVFFNYKREPRSTLRHFGFIADDTSSILAPRHKSMDVSAVAVMDAAAIKELQAQVADLRSEVAALQKIR